MIEFSQMPANWLQVKLVEVASLNMGQSPSSSDVNDTGQGIAFFQGKADFGKLHPTPRKFCTAPKKIAESGDILLSVRAPVGPTNVANQTMAIGRGLAAIRAEASVAAPTFLLHYFRYIEPWMSQQGTGTTFKAISGVFLKDLNTVLPPLVEQKVIADKLDTLLAQVEKTKLRLGRIPQILKRFRQSILAAAVSGRLTAEWRGYELFSCKDKIFFDVIKSAQVGLVRSSSEQMEASSDPQAIPYLKMNNIDNDWGTTLQKIVFVHVKAADLKKYQLDSGDWLFNTRNSSELVGKSCVWKGTGEYVYNNNILRVRLKDGYLSEYLEIWFRSPEGRASLEKIKSATTNVAAIYQKQLLKQIISFPDVKEQAEIIYRVDQLFAHADRIEQLVNNALTRVNNLTQSILIKAFRGELTDQWRKDNFALVSGENSAQALLEKIKLEREKLNKQPKPKGTSAKKRIANKMNKEIIKVADALREANQPLSGQQLLAAAGYPVDSSTEDLEKFFLDIRDAIAQEKTIVKLKRSDDGQDWFALAETTKQA